MIGRFPKKVCLDFFRMITDSINSLSQLILVAIKFFAPVYYLPLFVKVYQVGIFRIF